MDDYYDDDPNAHPYLDMEEQRQHVAGEKWRDHLKWCDKMVELQRLSLPNRRVALKILVNEAFQRDVQRCRAEFKKFGVDSLKLTNYAYASDRSPKERLAMELEHIKREWHIVAMNVLDEMGIYDMSSIVLKYLSCMCVFIPDSICREYGDNADSRQQRMDNMRELIGRLADEGKLFIDEDDFEMQQLNQSNANANTTGNNTNSANNSRLQTPQKSSTVSPSLAPRGAYSRYEEGTQSLEEEDFGDFVCPLLTCVAEGANTNVAVPPAILLGVDAKDGGCAEGTVTQKKDAVECDFFDDETPQHHSDSDECGVVGGASDVAADDNGNSNATSGHGTSSNDVTMIMMEACQHQHMEVDLDLL